MDVHKTSRVREAVKKENVDAIREQWNPAAIRSSGELHNR
jgi:hypothetical protein